MGMSTKMFFQTSFPTCGSLCSRPYIADSSWRSNIPHRVGFLFMRYRNSDFNECTGGKRSLFSSTVFVRNVKLPCLLRHKLQLHFYDFSKLSFCINGLKMLYSNTLEFSLGLADQSNTLRNPAHTKDFTLTRNDTTERK